MGTVIDLFISIVRAWLICKKIQVVIILIVNIVKM